MVGAPPPPAKGPVTPAAVAPHFGNAPGVHPQGTLPPGAKPTVTQVPPNAAVHPQAVKPQAPKPPPQVQRPKPPKNEKRDEGGNR
jgi:hypothetical protein